MAANSRLYGSQYPVEILSVKTGVHVNGEWYSRTFFSHLGSVEVIMTLKVTDPGITQVCLTFTVMDFEQHPVLFKSCFQAIGEGETQEVPVNLGLIPNYSSLGNAALYSNVLTGLPSQGGKPLCPQNRQNLMIWWNSADINCDYLVSVQDVALVCASYGRSDSDPLWNERCDIATPYRSIDIFDVLEVVSDYSKEWKSAT
jgi:hypothetical protein